MGVFAHDQSDGLQILNGGANTAYGIERSDRVGLIAIFPEPRKISVAASVPPKAGIFFIEAKEDLLRARDPAGVIGKCRSVLDLCLKALGAQGQSRRKRIADLRSKGMLTESLAVWAERLWDDGNDAIHDLEGDPTSAQQHVKFLELFFEVAFELPAQVAAAQGEASDTDEAS